MNALPPVPVNELLTLEQAAPYIKQSAAYWRRVARDIELTETRRNHRRQYPLRTHKKFPRAVRNGHVWRVSGRTLYRFLVETERISE